MDDAFLELILKSLKGKPVLELPGFRIVSDCNIFAVSLVINDEFVVYREKGANKDISFSTSLNLSALQKEIDAVSK